MEHELHVAFFFSFFEFLNNILNFRKILSETLHVDNDVLYVFYDSNFTLFTFQIQKFIIFTEQNT